MSWSLLWWALVPLAAVSMACLGWRWMAGAPARTYALVGLAQIPILLPVLLQDGTDPTGELVARAIASVLVLSGLGIRFWRARRGRRFYGRPRWAEKAGGDPSGATRPTGAGPVGGWPSTPPWDRPGQGAGRGVDGAARH